MRLIISWILFCYIPFGFVILLSILNQKGKFEWEIFSIVGIIWIIAIVNTINIMKKNN